MGWRRDTQRKPWLQASSRAWEDVRVEEGLWTGEETEKVSGGVGSRWCKELAPGEMVGVFLLWVFVGRCSPLSLAVPAARVAVVPGGTALLPAALRLPALPPPFFQVRWRFLPTGRLVLLLAAQDCGGAAPWRQSCRLDLEQGRGYEGRVGLGPHDASLLLRDARPEDAGTYRVSVLGLDVQASAEVNLTLAPIPTPAADPTTVLPPTTPAPANSTEPQDLWFPASPPEALRPGSLLRPLLRGTELDGEGTVVSNAVRLGLAGLVLCLLVLIVGEYVLSMRNKNTSGTGSPPDAAATITTLSTIYVLQEMPIPDASEELYASLSF